MEYIVIYYNEDGGSHASAFTEETLLEALNDDRWGDNPNIAGTPEDIEKISSGFFVGLLILRGPPIVPKPKEKVIEYTLD